MATRSERRQIQTIQKQRKTLARMDLALATTITLVRHGQTDWNSEMRLQGHRDTELNALGRQQANELAKALSSETFDAVYSSDLKRALQTAEAITALLPAACQKIRTSDQLRERSLGVVEGLTLAEAAESQTTAFQALRGGDDNLAVPGGESRNAMRERVVAEVECIASAHPGQSVLLVAHGGVIHAVYKHTTGGHYDGPVTNASVHRIRVQGRSWAMVEWNAAARDNSLTSNGEFGGRADEG